MPLISGAISFPSTVQMELEAVPDPEPLPDEYAEYEEDTDISDTAANVTE